MPRGNGTGPAGLGSMTGRGAGFCAGYPTPGFANNHWGRGGFGRGGNFFGGGRFRGRGFRNMSFSYGMAGLEGVNDSNVSSIPAGMTPKQEARLLKSQMQIMQDNLDALNHRIQELEELEADSEKSKNQD